MEIGTTYGVQGFKDPGVKKSRRSGRLLWEVARDQATLTVSVPRPATPPTMVSPDTTAATPSGVPV